MSLDVGELCGATFDDLKIDWRNGTALVHFLASVTHKATHTLRVTGVTRAAFVRSERPSAAVKDARCSDSVFELTMESGETLRIEAAEFALR